MRKIGFIGVGIMGKGMVRNLLRAGFELHVFAHDVLKVAGVISAGAIYHSEIGDCVKDCEAVITMVGFPKDVEDVYFTKGNILDSAKKGTYLIDMTTSSPALAERLFEEGKGRGFHVLDAPVTGGEAGAKNASLSILVGGEKEDFEACQLLFRAMGTNVSYQGKAGNGQHAKLANQILVAGALSGVCEALTYAKAKGLNVGTLLKATSTGSGGSRQLDTQGPKIMGGDFAPGFSIRYFAKDLTLAEEEAAMSGLNLEMLQTVLKTCQELEAAGYGALGTGAMIKHYAN